MRRKIFQSLFSLFLTVVGFVYMVASEPRLMAELMVNVPHSVVKETARVLPYSVKDTYPFKLIYISTNKGKVPKEGDTSTDVSFYEMKTVLSGSKRAVFYKDREFWKAREKLEEDGHVTKEEIEQLYLDVERQAKSDKTNHEIYFKGAFERVLEIYGFKSEDVHEKVFSLFSVSEKSAEFYGDKIVYVRIGFGNPQNCMEHCDSRDYDKASFIVDAKNAHLLSFVIYNYEENPFDFKTDADDVCPEQPREERCRRLFKPDLCWSSGQCKYAATGRDHPLVKTKVFLDNKQEIVKAGGEYVVEGDLPPYQPVEPKK